MHGAPQWPVRARGHRIAGIAWRGAFADAEVNALHAAAFGHGSIDDPWNERVERHSLGWVVARDDVGSLIGWANLVWDGGVHVWLQDVIVALEHQGTGVGRDLVGTAVAAARDAGCEWVHADFDDDVAGFYLDGCGFMPTGAGLFRL